MIREKYSIKTEETSLNIVQGEIESIRKKNITKTGFRIYDHGKIGVSGAIGAYDEDGMFKKSLESLSLEIPYEYEVTGDTKKSVRIESDFENGADFTSEIEELLKDLKRDNPGFIFSNKINYVNEEVCLKNDIGLDLESTVSRLESSLLLKEKSSPNLMDGFVGFEGNKWNKDEFVRLANMTCEGLRKNTDIENGYHKVIMIPFGSDFLSKMYSELNGLKYGTGGSIFSGKIGQKLFSEDFTLYQSLSPEDGVFWPFFDTEGTLNENFRYPLIENGILKTPYTDKKTARDFKLEHTGSAGGTYDSVPTLSPFPLVMEKSKKTIKEILNGEMAVFVLFAAGGDFTPEGKYATPVQTSFLFDGERFVGRLPQLNMTSNIYDMFGKDFLGVSSDSFTKLSPMHLPVFRMKTDKI